ncbi:zinc knuckle CX2CX4HX4C containing protein [Tanacetum coccineum]
MFNVVDITNLQIIVGHPNGTPSTISLIGNLKLTYNVFLYDDLVVPGYYVCLLSVNKLIKYNKLFVGFNEDKYYINDLKKEITFVTHSESSGLYLLDMDFDTSLDLNMLKSTHVSTYESGDALIVCKPLSEPTLLGVLVSSDEAVELNLLSVVNSMTGVMLDVVHARVMHEATMGTLAGNGVTTDIDGITAMEVNDIGNNSAYGSYNTLTMPTATFIGSTSPNSVHNSDPSEHECLNTSGMEPSMSNFVVDYTIQVSGQHGLGNIIGSINNQVDSSNPTGLHGICDTGNINVDKGLLEQISDSFNDKVKNAFPNGTALKAVLLDDDIPSNNTPIFQSVFIPKLVFYAGEAGMVSSAPIKGKFDSDKGLQDVLKSGSWMIRNSLIILKKWMMNTSLFKEELTRILVWVKLHDVPVQVFLEDGISLIATQIVKDDEEMVRVEYEWKPPCCEQCKIFGHVYDQCPKNATTIPTVDMNNDGFQTVVNKRKSGKTGSTNTSRSSVTVGKATWQPIKPKVRFEPKAHGNSPKNVTPNVSTFAKDVPNIVSKKQLAKAVDIPSSSYTSVTTKKGGRQVPTRLSNIPTSNPYDWLSQEFDPENYTNTMQIRCKRLFATEMQRNPTIAKRLHANFICNRIATGIKLFATVLQQKIIRWKYILFLQRRHFPTI